MDDRNYKKHKCKVFFDELKKALSDTHESVGSCNADISEYLVPKGAAHQISYYGKPTNSFRLSDHWNWYSNTKKCKDKDYIQCFSVDIPMPRRRIREGKASHPRYGCQVAFFDSDKKYHCVYGDRYDHMTRTWTWMETDPYKLAAELEKTFNKACPNMLCDQSQIRGE